SAVRCAMPKRAAPRPSRAHDRLAAHLGLDRVGDEALLVGGMMQALELRRRRPAIAAEGDLGAQGDHRHGHPALFVFLHDAHGCIGIAVHHEALLRRERQEKQHMAARQGRDERLLRIHRRRVGQRRPHDLRRRGGRHLDAAVEPPRMAAAVAIVQKVLPATLPENLCRVPTHALPPALPRRTIAPRRQPPARPGPDRSKPGSRLLPPPPDHASRRHSDRLSTTCVALSLVSNALLRPPGTGRSRRHSAASLRFSSSFTCPGLALPPVAFITWPTKNPNSLSLPERYSASCFGLAAITWSMTCSMAPVSVIC